MSHPRPRQSRQIRQSRPSEIQQQSTTQTVVSPAVSQPCEDVVPSNNCNNDEGGGERERDEHEETEEPDKSEKRGQELLRGTLDEVSAKRQRRRGGGSSKKSAKKTMLAGYKRAGRWIVRAFGPWANVTDAFRHGLAQDGFFDIENPDCDDADEDNDDEQPDELRDTHLKLYRGVLSLVPNFKKTIEGFGDNYESIMELIDLMERESKSARQQDTFKMKEGIPGFFAYDSSASPELPIPRDKTGRGFNHMLTARALCPRSYIFSFSVGLGFLERITSGNVEITSDQFPNFLYDETEAEKLTAENPSNWDAEKGLLWSSLCLWSYKCIFMGNGFWTPQDSKTKASVGKINGMNQVTPVTIAYAIAQARFALSSCEEWGAEDGQFILRDFYQAILELFDDEEDEWAVDTLAWWNEQIFPDTVTSKNTDSQPNPNSAQSRAKLARMERAKKRAQTSGA